jgi:tricorn protease-like protein
MINSAGDRIVFWGQDKPGAGFNIWVSGPDGKCCKRLTDDRTVNGHPFWSADGEHIVFFSYDVSGAVDWQMSRQFDIERKSRHIWIMDSNGGNRRPLTYGPHVDERPCISPDGTVVVFVSNRSGRLNLWSVDLDSCELKQITRHDGLDYRPIFSPDGKHLAFFSSCRPGQYHDLAVMKWPCGPVEWPVPPGRFRWIHGPFWLKNRRSILFHGCPSKEQGCTLWALCLDSGSIREIRVPRLQVYAHASLDKSGSTMAFDSAMSL